MNKYAIAFCLVFLCVVQTVYAAPVNLRDRKEMDFATVFVMPSGDNITLSPSSVISSANGSIFSGTPESASFSAQGDKNAAASISFSVGDVLTGPGAAMPLGNFTHNAGVTPAFTSNKKLDFKVGATLTINPNQASGTYSGIFTVTVDYQ